MRGQVTKPGGVIATTHIWNLPRPRGRGCGCFFCHPRDYPPLPPGWGLCARCGVLMVVANVRYWREEMECCAPCDADMENEKQPENGERE